MYPHDGTPVPVQYETYVGAGQLYVTATVRVVTRSTMGINVCFNGRTFRLDLVTHHPWRIRSGDVMHELKALPQHCSW